MNTVPVKAIRAVTVEQRKMNRLNEQYAISQRAAVTTAENEKQYEQEIALRILRHAAFYVSCNHLALEFFLNHVKQFTERRNDV